MIPLAAFVRIQDTFFPRTSQRIMSLINISQFSRPNCGSKLVCMIDCPFQCVGHEVFCVFSDVVHSRALAVLVSNLLH